jgi:sterol desaturase/sphingolipid hydroxylase (fatty acid hydroxylase superfamily)
MRQTKIGYFADFVVYPLAIVLLIAYGLRGQPARDAPYFVALFVFGAILWTLVEYLLHRFVFHEVAFIRDMHDAHHQEPTAYVGSPAALGLLAFAALSFAPLRLVCGSFAACGLTAGLMLGYLGYLTVHHGVHHWRITPGSRLYMLKHRHARHHYAKIEGNYGVTTLFWDSLFGTSLEDASKASRRVTEADRGEA